MKFQKIIKIKNYFEDLFIKIIFKIYFLKKTINFFHVKKSNK